MRSVERQLKQQAAEQSMAGDTGVRKPDRKRAKRSGSHGTNGRGAEEVGEAAARGGGGEDAIPADRGGAKQKSRMSAPRERNEAWRGEGGRGRGGRGEVGWCRLDPRLRAQGFSKF